MTGMGTIDTDVGRSVESVMERVTVMLRQTTTFHSAASLLRDGGHRWAVVVDDDRRPIGIFTETDAFRHLTSNVADQVALLCRVRDVMSTSVCAVSIGASLNDARALMVRNGLRRLPVIDDDGGRLVGVVSFLDLLRAQTAELQRERDRLDQLVRDRTRELETANQHLTSLSHEDPLLGIGNRRAMNSFLDHVDALSRRQGEPYGLLLVDVDLFKQYNDAYGHPSGDRMLVTIVSLLTSSLRATDRMFRYGGEEFLIVLPASDGPGTETVAARALDAVRRRALPHSASPYGVVTISAGGTAFIGRAAGWAPGLRDADIALYRAKHDGRNRAYIAKT